MLKTSFSTKSKINCNNIFTNWLSINNASIFKELEILGFWFGLVFLLCLIVSLTIAALVRSILWCSIVSVVIQCPRNTMYLDPNSLINIAEIVHHNLG